MPPSPPSDDDDPTPGLLRAAQGGDRAALDALARRWWPSMRRWALLELGDPTLAEDAAQEALVRLMRHVGTCRADRPFAPWLHAVVRNAARDAAARRGWVADPDGDGDRGGDLDGDLHPGDRRIDLARAADVALAAFDRLSPRQRQVLDLCDRQDHTPSEAAALLGIAPSTARALLHQGRQVVRAAVLRHGDGVVVDLLRGAR